MILNTEFKKYVKIIDQSIINSYPNIRSNIKYNKFAKIYKKNDLLIHYAGFRFPNNMFNSIMKENFYNSIQNYLE